MKFGFTQSSRNIKTGPIPTVVVSRDTCPPSCHLYNGGCYALSGPTRFVWNRVGEKGIDFLSLLDKVKTIKDGQLWRYGVAGDLPGEKEEIDLKMLNQLVEANKGKRGFAYSHKNPRILENSIGFAHANQNGFTINLSSNNAAEADEYLKMNIAPVVTLMPVDTGSDWKTSKTPEGNMIVRCPAEYQEKTTCANCGGNKGALCSRSDRKYVIGFTAHGAAKNKASTIAKKYLNIVE